MKLYDTVTLPATGESAERAAELVADGYSRVRVGETLMFQRTAADVPTPSASSRAAAVPGNMVTGDGSGSALPAVADAERAAGPDSGSGDAARAEIVAELGARIADALAAAGYHTLEHARTAYGLAPDAFAQIPGVGPATLAKLSA